MQVGEQILPRHKACGTMKEAFDDLLQAIDV